MSIAQRFMDLFRGNDRAHGTFDVKGADRESDGKKQGVARIIKEETTLQMWEQHLAGEKGLGIIPIRDSNDCAWGSIDIDEYDFDHRKFITKCKSHSVPVVVCRSKSGGAHVYFFFRDYIDAGVVQSKLKEIAAFLGYGGSEVFPKQDRILVERGDTGNFLNMPYFAGDRSTRYAFDDEANALSPEEFLAHATARILTEEQFLAIKTKRENKKGPLPDGPPCLQHLAAQGFGEGSRNNALFNLGVYARMADPDNWEGLLHKYNMDLLQPPLSHNEVGIIIKQLQKKDYFYKCEDQPINAFCNKELCMGRKFGVGPGQANNDLSSLTKIDGDPPIWLLNVDGQRVELSTEGLVQQSRFQKDCVAQINRYPVALPAKTWQSKIQSLLDNLTVVEVPPDATMKGEFSNLLISFCTDRAKGNERENILMGIAVWTEGKVFFQLRDIKKHLLVNDFEAYTGNKITLRLQELGAEKMFWRVKGKGVHVWSLPEAFFKAEEMEQLELPPLTREKDVM